MRTYPNNSPQAAARIVALAMLADGPACADQLDMLHELGATEQLGLQAEELHDVLCATCEDLAEAPELNCADACQIDGRALGELLTEIDDPALCLKVLRLCVAVVEADGHVAEGESIMLGAAVEQWGMHRAMLQPQDGQALVR